MLRWPWASVMSFASTKEIPGAPLFDGVSFAPKGRFLQNWASLSIGQIGLKLRYIPYGPEPKWLILDPPKRPFLDPPKRVKNRNLGSPQSIQVKVTHQHSVG